MFVLIFICQNLSFRSFLPLEPLMIASLTFPEVLVQRVSLFISSSCFSLWLPGVAYFTAQDSPLSQKEHPWSAKWEYIYLPSRKSSFLEHSCVDSLQGQWACLCSIPHRQHKNQVLLLQGKWHSTHRKTQQEQFLSFLNKPCRVIQSAAENWFLHVDCSGLFS